MISLFYISCGFFTLVELSTGFGLPMLVSDIHLGRTQRELKDFLMYVREVLDCFVSLLLSRIHQKRA